MTSKSYLGQLVPDFLLDGLEGPYVVKGNGWSCLERVWDR